MKHLSTLFFFLLFSLTPGLLIAQTGGTRVYRFLDLPYSSRAAALGGKITSMPAEDLNFAFSNPALLGDAVNNNLIINYINYFSDINFGSVGYAFRTPLPVSFAAGMDYINYGQFTAADETGTITGTFSAAEYIFHLSASYSLLDSMLSVGVSLKPLLSVLERYQSFGLVMDLGVSYHSRDELFTAALLLRNAGFQVTPYVKGDREPVPFEIRAGLSAKLRHAPFRFVFTLQDLQKPDLLYPYPENPEDPDATFPEKKEYSGISRFGENFMRHTILGLEFIPVKSFVVSIGYNYRRRRELQVPARAGMVGFSIGASLRLKKFSISYGRASYHLAGASNHISFSTNLKNLFPGREL